MKLVDTLVEVRNFGAGLLLRDQRRRSVRFWDQRTGSLAGHGTGRIANCGTGRVHLRRSQRGDEVHQFGYDDRYLTVARRQGDPDAQTPTANRNRRARSRTRRSDPDNVSGCRERGAVAGLQRFRVRYRPPRAAAPDHVAQAVERLAQAVLALPGILRQQRRQGATSAHASSDTSEGQGLRDGAIPQTGGAGHGRSITRFIYNDYSAFIKRYRFFVANEAANNSGCLGSGLVDHSQKMTVAASAMAEKKTVGHRS